MTIRDMGGKCIQIIDQGEGEKFLVVDGSVYIATADTREEAEQAKRAFETVLLPRFTRDEAIALCVAHESEFTACGNKELTAYVAGLRAALEALAAAGVFVDGRNMAEKLDAAGIR